MKQAIKQFDVLIRFTWFNVEYILYANGRKTIINIIANDLPVNVEKLSSSEVYTDVYTQIVEAMNNNALDIQPSIRDKFMQTMADFRNDVRI